ncbi:MAG: non-homologous end-joining DNA ligase [Polyangiales bacterium]
MATKVRATRTSKTAPSAARSATKKKAATTKAATKKKATRASTPKKASTPRKKVAERLAKYRSMRDFGETPEPSGARAAGAATKAHALSFVVQKHAASHLHYDFRLEHDGVLLSWSVPKGPSLEPGARRLAVRTEDHPIDYADFEGIIPKGEYGGGTVIVWDRGAWVPEEEPGEGVRKGKLTFTLHGDKLRGRFHLARTKMEGGKREHWLLFKGRDEAAREGSDIVVERPESALSGRTIEQVAALPARVWHSNRAANEQTAAKGRAAKKRASPSKDARAAHDDVGSGDVVALVKQLPVRFSFTNLEKVLYPENNVRKAELIAYFASISAFALPHLGRRPLTLVRCPNGPAGQCFFQKQAKDVPAAIKRIPIRFEKKTEDYMFVDDLAGLLAAAQLGTLELHTWGCHVDDVEVPDQLVFDLDPAEDVDWDRVVEGALSLRTRLGDLGLESFVKTTGGKGLHVVAPIANKLDWEAHKELSHAVAEALARAQPDRYLTNMRKSLRQGRIFIDYLRNGRGATAIAPYSTRARTGATVATPLAWEELEAGVNPRDFTLFTVTSRLSSPHADPWRAYTGLKQRVAVKALRALGVKA